MEDHGYHSYIIKIDGSGCLKRQNCKHLQSAPTLHHAADSTTSIKSCEPPKLPTPTTLSPRLLTQLTTLATLPALMAVDITGSVPLMTTNIAEPPASSYNLPPQAPFTDDPL